MFPSRHYDHDMVIVLAGEKATVKTSTSPIKVDFNLELH